MNGIIPPVGSAHKPEAFLPWLSGLGVDTRGMWEEKCLAASIAPDPEGCVRLARVAGLVVHHSATREGGVRAFRVLHRLVNHWRDVGYHFVIGNGTHTEDGCLETGRPDHLRGAHAKGANDCSIGVCLVGDFTSDRPTEKQLSALGSLLQELMERHRLIRRDILLHRQVRGSRTECPGKCFTEETLREALERASEKAGGP